LNFKVYVRDRNVLKNEKKIALHNIGGELLNASRYHKNCKNNDCNLTKQEELSNLILFSASISFVLCSLELKGINNPIRGE